MYSLAYALLLKLQIRAEALRSRLLTRYLRSQGCEIGDNVYFGWGTTVGLATGARLVIADGARVDRGTDLILHPGGCIELGRNVYIGKRNVISSVERVAIGENSMTAHQVTILDCRHEYERADLPIRDQGMRVAPISVGADCWIAANCSVLPGVTLGDKTIVAAHSLVNESVPGGCIVGGVPAALIRKI